MRLCSEAEEGGVVKLLTRLVGPPDIIPGEDRAYGDSEADEPDVGECDKGVFPSEMLLFGRRIWERGRGIGTPLGGLEAVCVEEYMEETEEFDMLEEDRWCVG